MPFSTGGNARRPRGIRILGVAVGEELLVEADDTDETLSLALVVKL